MNPVVKPVERDIEKEIRDHFGPQRQCTWCSNNGTMATIEVKTGMEYGFRCTYCKAADIRGFCDRLPRWNHNLSARFRVTRVEPILIWSGKQGDALKNDLADRGVNITAEPIPDEQWR